ncbi:MAG: hypothetical protein KGI90_13355 [Burkholderiales bacterium]|nr:hypothetical protein [Burkholderiales bacterium]MDE2276871.1 hypothetical protein [Burkholderiales bacterium]
MTTRALRLFAASITAALAGMAGAHAMTADSAPAAPPTADLRSVCPGVDDALQQALGPVMSRVQQEGVLRVLMQVDDGHVSGVSAHGWPAGYRAAVQRAVSALSCSGAAGRHAALSFEVHFAEPGEAN